MDRFHHLGSRALRRDLEGHDVRVAQDYLRKAGFRVRIDGLYGPGTVRAVRQFERANGRPADGTLSMADITFLRGFVERGGQAARVRGVRSMAATADHAGLNADGTATAPEGAPPEIAAIIAAGNRIATLPYRYGGGHGRWEDNGYDCSGSVSYALHGANLLDSPLASGDLARWGESGPGEWVTIYANGGHAFIPRHLAPADRGLEQPLRAAGAEHQDPAGPLPLLLPARRHPGVPGPGGGDRARSPPADRRRGGSRRRAAERPQPGHRRPARCAHALGDRDGLRGAAWHPARRLGLRLGAHAAGQPGVRAGPRGRPAPRPRRLHRHHRRRAGGDGGGQPRRARGRRAVGRPQHRAALRAARQRLRRRRAGVPLLLHAQDHVRALRERVRRAARRLRHARRALRGAHAHPDRQDPPLPRGPGRRRPLARAAGVDARAAHRRRPDHRG